MNEKIKTILQTVKGEMYIPLGYSSPQGSTNLWGMSDEELQKFAELIVKECADICKEHPSRTLSNNWNAYAVAPDIVRIFEEYFGVEE